MRAGPRTPVRARAGGGRAGEACAIGIRMLACQARSRGRSDAGDGLACFPLSKMSDETKEKVSRPPDGAVSRRCASERRQRAAVCAPETLGLARRPRPMGPWRAQDVRRAAGRSGGGVMVSAHTRSSRRRGWLRMGKREAAPTADQERCLDRKAGSRRFSAFSWPKPKR